MNHHAAVILAEDFSGLFYGLLILLGGLTGMGGLSFISSVRGRFPVLAVPALLGSLFLVTISLTATGEQFIALVWAIPLVVSLISFFVWTERRRDRQER
jgi:hypothetical protein